MPTPNNPPPLPPILVFRPLFPAFEAALSSKFSLLKPSQSPLPLHDFIASEAPMVRALVTYTDVPVGERILDLLPHLGLIVTTSSGVNHIDLAACARRGIAVASAGSGSSFSADVADYAVGLLIDVLRRVSAGNRLVRSGLWPVATGDYPLATKVSGKRIGIVGLGRIGYATAKRLEAFGCIISYTSRSKKSSVQYTYYPNIMELARESDVLILTCAFTSETHHIINKDVILTLGKNGVIINVGRGPLIDEKELVEQLTQGKIKGVGLDVFEHEPEVPKELLTMDNVVLSPHVAVKSSEWSQKIVEQVVGNLEAFFSSRPLLTPVV